MDKIPLAKLIKIVVVLLASVWMTGALYAQSLDAQLILPSKPFAENNVNMSYHPQTQKVNFLSVKAGYSISRPEGFLEDAATEGVARAFLLRHGPLFGVDNQAEELTVKRVKSASRGRSFVRFQQVYNGVPILGGELIVQLDAAKNIMSVNGEILPDLALETTPAIAEAAAQQHALAKIADVYKLALADLIASEAELLVYDPAIVSGRASKVGSRLVWHVDVTHRKFFDINEFVLVDAQSGQIALHFKQIDAAKDRTTYNLDAPDPLTPCRTEGEGPVGEDHCDYAHDYAGDTYDYYLNEHGRDSIDNAGMTIVSYVRSGGCVAGWSDFFGGMIYGDDCFQMVDDVVAHEWTHAVTNYESNLIYWHESGAINESLSDIWGEFVDLVGNVTVEDTSEVRWQIGEDTTGGFWGEGAIRDMQDPATYYHPDRMLSLDYFCGPFDLFDDNGGVHTNSGVGNKTAYLLTDGDSFNGYTISGLGISKVADLFYEVQTNLLTTSSDYGDLRNALNQACTNLNYTTSECQQVNDATLATQMDQTPCGGADGELDCSNGVAGAVALTAGVPYDGSTVGAPSKAMYYSCFGEGSHSGPEMVHTITIGGPRIITAALTNLTVDMDVFILAACDKDNCVTLGEDTATYYAPAAGTYYIVVDGLYGSYTLTVTTATAAAPISTFPYTEDFEEGGALPSGWYNTIADAYTLGYIVGDDFDWTVDAGGTSTSNTGPSVDHTLGTAAGYYVYTESSMPSLIVPVASLLTPWFNISGLSAPMLEFWYHMYGAEMGKLLIDVFANGNWHNDSATSLSGDHGDTWYRHTVDLSAYTGHIRIRFRGITGGTSSDSETSDMAIDDVKVFSGSSFLLWTR